jgi:hypothetical protein
MMSVDSANLVQLSDGAILWYGTTASVADTINAACAFISTSVPVTAPAPVAAATSAPDLDSATKSDAVAAPQQTAVGSTITFTSSVPNAEITVDNKFIGSTPSTLILMSGEHTVSVRKDGYNDWTRVVSTSENGNVNLNADMIARVLKASK